MALFSSLSKAFHKALIEVKGYAIHAIRYLQTRTHLIKFWHQYINEIPLPHLRYPWYRFYGHNMHLVIGTWLNQHFQYFITPQQDFLIMELICSPVSSQGTTF